MNDAALEGRKVSRTFSAENVLSIPDVSRLAITFGDFAAILKRSDPK
jgi:hypothetical protein